MRGWRRLVDATPLEGFFRRTFGVFLLSHFRVRNTPLSARLYSAQFCYNIIVFHHWVNQVLSTLSSGSHCCSK